MRSAERRRSLKELSASYFLSSAPQFATTVIGVELRSSGAAFTRNRWPSGEMSQRQEMDGAPPSPPATGTRNKGLATPAWNTGLVDIATAMSMLSGVKKTIP